MAVYQVRSAVESTSPGHGCRLRGLTARAMMDVPGQCDSRRAHADRACRADADRTRPSLVLSSARRCSKGNEHSGVAHGE
jgi:hypothetical protein